MRKAMIALLLGMFFVVTTAAPALAIRDPFDPVISQAQLAGDDGTGTGDGTGTTGDGTGTTNGADDDVAARNGSEGLANTGADTEPWLVAAYALIAIGAGAVVFSKVSAPAA